MRENAEGEVLRRILPPTFSAYLEKRGWKQQLSEDPRTTIWGRWNAVTGDEVKLLLPIDEELGDYELRLAEAIEVLSDFEGRPPRVVVGELIKNQDKSRLYLRIPRPVGQKVLLDKLVGAWGLDFFGLDSLSRRAIWELRSAACALTLVATVVTVLLVALFGMMFGSYGCLSFGLALPIAFVEAIYARSILTATFLSRNFGVYMSLAVRLIVTIVLGITLAQVLAIIIFHGPIERELRRQDSTLESEHRDFFSQVVALDQILERDTQDGYRAFKYMYWFALAVSVGTLLLPYALRLLLSSELQRYFAFDYAKAMGHDPEEDDNRLRGVAPNPSAALDDDRASHARRQ